MNEEKKVMQTQESAVEYLAPKVKVHEIKTRKLLCASELSNYNGTDWGTDE